MSVVDDSTVAYVDDLTARLASYADAERAVSMRAYMRDQFGFFGIPAPLRRQITRSVHVDWQYPLLAAELLFQREHRECHYVACDLLATPRTLRSLTITDVPSIVRLITTKSWWDTVDALAPTVLGGILRADRVRLRELAMDWCASDNIWLQRTAIIIQLKYKADTDADLLFELILQRAASKEFFVRKGAGWALREYAKVAPEAVIGFVETHRSRLSPLTVREALKHH